MRFDRRRARALSTGVFALGLIVACDDDPTGPRAIAPQNVTATAVATNKIRVAFRPVGGASGYLVQRATGASGGTFATVKELTGGVNDTVFVDSLSLVPETAYQYQVASIVAGDTSTWSLPSGNSVVTTLAPGNAGTAELTGSITANRVLSADTTYTLNGYVKVQSGASLTIPAGTRILGGAGNAATGGIGGSLFVYRGAKLFVNGTRERPVVFTSSRPAGARAPGDWGGIVIVGSARANRTGAPVNTESPSGTQEVYNQGADDNDNSGAIRYLRIEFAGYAVSQDNELNSLSMYAVGRGTQLENVQVVAGLDDGFEWFGGTVDGRYLVSYETGDDHFDASEGYRGRNQFMIAVQDTVLTPNADGSAGGAATDPQFFEIDGCSGQECAGGFNAAPYTMPVFANFTVVGPGAGVLPSGGGLGLLLRRGAAGTYVNGIVARTANRAIQFRDIETLQRFNEDSLSIRNLYLAGNVANFDPEADSSVATVGSRRYAQAKRFTTFSVDTASTGTSVPALFTAFPADITNSTTAAQLDFTPAAGAPAQIRTGGLATFSAPLAARMSTFFGGALQGTAYRGAADPAGTDKWWQGWTVYVRR